MGHLYIEGQRLPYTATCCNVVADHESSEVVETVEETVVYTDKNSGKEAEAVYRVDTLAHIAVCPNGCPDKFTVHEKRSTRLRAELIA